MIPTFSPTPSQLPSRRNLLRSLAAGAAGVLGARVLPAFALPEDKIKAVRYFTTPGDANGRQGQPMVNQSTNVVMIETQRGLIGIGEGGEPRTMEECASMLIRPRPVPHRNALATHDARILLPRGPRKAAFFRSA